MNTMTHEALARLRNLQGAAHVARLVDAGLTFAQAVQTAQRLYRQIEKIGHDANHDDAHNHDVGAQKV